MKKLTFLLFIAPLFLGAQVLQSNFNQLNFGVVNVGDTDSLQLTLTNTSNSSLSVSNVKFYTIYGDMPFSASQSSFSIPANGSHNIWIYFTPEHNIAHNTEVVFVHNATSGVGIVDLVGQGRFPMAYYDTTENLSEQALKNALKWKIGQGYVQLSYNVARDNMYATIDNFGGQVECAYTGRRATFNTRSGANSNSFNTEHTFPQGFFSSGLPMRSDIHHLFPTDVTANSQRGNLPFGIVTGTPSWTVGGSKKSSGNFEPRNTQKGRTARAMMYFVIRYQDYSNHFSVQQTTLKNWHTTYPVDSLEEVRNADIFALQSNRNPFVDYPQLAERITNFVANSVATTQFGIDILQTSINFGSFFTQTPDTFNYALVNRGNQTINFSNFSMTNTTDFSFAAGSGVNQSVSPGDAIIIQIIALTNVSMQFNESLSFNTNIPGSQSSFTIPIRGNSVVTSVDQVELKNQLEIFPNPMQDQLTIRTLSKENLRIRLFDSIGKELNPNINYAGSTYTLNTQSLEKGLYVLEVSSASERVIRKLIK